MYCLEVLLKSWSLLELGVLGVLGVYCSFEFLEFTGAWSLLELGVLEFTVALEFYFSLEFALTVGRRFALTYYLEY
jgi:hypothetical protein